MFKKSNKPEAAKKLDFWFWVFVAIAVIGYFIGSAVTQYVIAIPFLIISAVYAVGSEIITALSDTQKEWVNIKNGLPKKGQRVWYYFEPVGVNYGYYDGTFEGLPCFVGPRGVLTGDVTHWADAPVAPEPPN